MKKTALLIALAIASIGSVQAQAAPEKQMHFLVGGGLTFGGDSLDTLRFERGNDYEVRAGGLAQLHVGVDYRVNDEFSLQTSVGYHVNAVNARNGDARFDRVPMELLAYYHLAPNWRIGAGARYVSGSNYKTTGAAGNANFKYDNAVGPVIEGEYLLGSSMGVKVRYVRETYQQKDVYNKVDGSHIGILANFYF